MTPCRDPSVPGTGTLAKPENGEGSCFILTQDRLTQYKESAQVPGNAGPAPPSALLSPPGGQPTGSLRGLPSSSDGSFPRPGSELGATKNPRWE